MSNAPSREDTDLVRPPFDPIFPQLVNEGDSPDRKLIGYIGFGLYHESKREWASEFRQREGRYPSEEDTQAYERSWTGSRKSALENAAAQLLAAYADSVVSQLEVQILRSALRGSFLRFVGRWVFSAALYTLALIGITAALLWSGVELPAVNHLGGETAPTAPKSLPPSMAVPPPSNAPQPPFAAPQEPLPASQAPALAPQPPSAGAQPSPPPPESPPMPPSPRPRRVQ